ncbi:efflux RND transporter periplasmic adaptor subunit [Candidatus Obscuribacterales bacterium]|nr:efflux RND transporter periplasmic adaptor subunit [Candidatus Obscuribacterales bacterium]MBX3153350.1 efflux RND transporter periplasmic adaptor subunit [Candidatus Obscuribacterales bacterium]
MESEHNIQQDPSGNSSLAEIFSLKNIVFVVIVMAIAGGAFYFMWMKRQKPLVLEKPANTEITLPVVPVVKKTLFREDQLPGEINAYQDVLIYPKVPGFVKELNVDRGSVVKKGQLMVRMYAPEYLAKRHEFVAKVAAAKADLAAEESKVEDLKAELEKRRANLLADQSTYQRVYAASLVPGVIADNDVVQWSQSVKADRQDVNSMIKRVNAKDHEVSMKREEVDAMVKAFESFADFASYLEIYAPFDGYVTERKMHVGSFVGPDGTGAYPPICRLKQLDLLRIVAPVPEDLVAGVIIGSQVEFSVSSFPGKRFKGTVARLANNLDKDTRTMPVELNYLNPDFKLVPGMFTKVYWPTRRPTESLFVPITSVVSTPLDTFVCKVANDRVEWVPVRKGQIMDQLVEVFGNIKEGDVVAKEGSEELQNQSRVKPVKVPVSISVTAPKANI